MKMIYTLMVFSGVSLLLLVLSFLKIFINKKNKVKSYVSQN